jgi:hydrogenase nickel incorporation protein HypA/HybF
LHELSICEAIADAATRRAQGRPVRRVTVRIGHFCQVVPDSLQFSWELLVAETPLADAALDVEHVPAVAACAACGERTQLELPILVCGACGSTDVELVSGRELLLVALDVAEGVR